MSRTWGLWVVALLGLIATPALAQTGGAAAPGPAAAKAARTVVVVADAFDDETENAKLRAKIYDVCRERGYAPDGKADVKGAAEQAGAMQEGKLSAEAGPLDGVRKSVGAALLVRVAKDPDGVRVLVVKDGDAKSKVVATADAALAAVSQLVGAPAKAAAAKTEPPASPASTPAADEGMSAGFILKPKKKDDEPDYGDPKVLAEGWKNRGGARVSYGAHAHATGLIIPNTLYAATNPETGALEVGKKTTYGVGLGVGLDLSVMYLPMPEPASGSTSWAAFRAGLRLDVSGLYVRPPLKYTYRTEGVVTGRDTKYDNVAYIYGVLPMELGVLFGFGDFRLPTLWRGVALGLAYAPSFIFSLKVGEKEDATDSSFNYGGFELSADIAKVEVGKGSQPQIRLSALVLPRVKDDLPWLASFGVGAIWY